MLTKVLLVISFRLDRVPFIFQFMSNKDRDAKLQDQDYERITSLTKWIFLQRQVPMTF